MPYTTQNKQQHKLERVFLFAFPGCALEAWPEAMAGGTIVFP